MVLDRVRDRTEPLPSRTNVRHAGRSSVPTGPLRESRARRETRLPPPASRPSSWSSRASSRPLTIEIPEAAEYPLLARRSATMGAVSWGARPSTPSSDATTPSLQGEARDPSDRLDTGQGGEALHDLLVEACNALGTREAGMRKAELERQDLVRGVESRTDPQPSLSASTGSARVARHPGIAAASTPSARTAVTAVT